MGYTTYFNGEINIVPPLNAAEEAFLTAFNDADHRDGGGMPGIWCQWVPTGPDTIGWDEGEKAYDMAEWLAYIIDSFLKPDALASDPVAMLMQMHGIDEPTAIEKLRVEGNPFAGFTFDHVCNGTVDADGEDSDDFWTMIVRDNVLTTYQGTVAIPELDRAAHEVELRPLLDNVARTSLGDSNDAEIEALQNALEVALAQLGIAPTDPDTLED